MKLRELFHRAVRPRIHERFGAILLEIPDLDSDEESFDISLSQTVMHSLSGIGLILDYQDSKGEKTQRIVTCKQFSVEDGKEYLMAYCHHRQSVRMFRIDRIGDIFDPVTGESLSPVQAFFAQFSPDKVSDSGLSWGLSVSRRADLIALLNALVFIARCDREFHPAEQASMEAALTSFWLRLELLGDPDFEDILSYANRLSPDGETFWLAMRRFSEDKHLASIFKQRVRALVEADGVVRQEEAFWSLEIEDYLSGS